MLVRTIVHHDAYSVPILVLMEWLSVSDRCQHVSSFVLLVVVLIRGNRTVPSVILGDSRDLTGSGSRST